MQRCVNLVDLEKCKNKSIWLQKLALIQRERERALQSLLIFGEKYRILLHRIFQLRYIPADHVFWDPKATTGGNASGVCAPDLEMALDRGLPAAAKRKLAKAPNAKLCAKTCAADSLCQVRTALKY